MAHYGRHYAARHRQVSFIDIALDFESHASRPLPPTPQSRFVGTEMSLPEKG